MIPSILKNRVHFASHATVHTVPALTRSPSPAESAGLRTPPSPAVALPPIKTRPRSRSHSRSPPSPGDALHSAYGLQYPGQHKAIPPPHAPEYAFAHWTEPGMKFTSSHASYAPEPMHAYAPEPVYAYAPPKSASAYTSHSSYGSEYRPRFKPERSYTYPSDRYGYANEHAPVYAPERAPTHSPERERTRTYRRESRRSYSPERSHHSYERERESEREHGRGRSYSPEEHGYYPSESSRSHRYSPERSLAAPTAAPASGNTHLHSALAYRPGSTPAASFDIRWAPPFHALDQHAAATNPPVRKMSLVCSLLPRGVRVRPTDGGSYVSLGDVLLELVVEALRRVPSAEYAGLPQDVQSAASRAFHARIKSAADPEDVRARGIRRIDILAAMGKVRFAGLGATTTPGVWVLNLA